MQQTKQVADDMKQKLETFVTVRKVGEKNLEITYKNDSISQNIR